MCNGLQEEATGQIAVSSTSFTLSCAERNGEGRDYGIEFSESNLSGIDPPAVIARDPSEEPIDPKRSVGPFTYRQALEAEKRYVSSG